jgi:hypothetical protein
LIVRIRFDLVPHVKIAERRGATPLAAVGMFRLI